MVPSYTSNPSPSDTPDRAVRVLVVDDSAYVRKVVSMMLSRSPFIEVVGTARDGEDALEQVERLQPDVVTLDLLMPRLDGIGFLERQMARRPIPVVVVSITGESGELALRALDAGATDFVQKPTALATERVLEIGDELIEKVRVAGTVQLRHLPPAVFSSALVPAPSLAEPSPTRTLPGKATRTTNAVVIGISTGGPQALRYLIAQLPASFPVPVAIVMHMPIGYTDLYAQRLDEIAALKVLEAREGVEMLPGQVLIAPAGRHLTLDRDLRSDRVMAHLAAQPFDTPHRPSVDVLFRSAALVYGSGLLGIVMTGMGSDGLRGAAQIKSHGGLVYTEAESTCVVYGMPRSVMEAGLSDRNVPLDRMAQAILETT